MSSDVQVAQTNTFIGIGTDARIRPFAWEQCFRGPDLDNVETVPSTTWHQASFLPAQIGEVESDQLSYACPWRRTFEKISPSPENRKTETAHMYRGAISHMGIENVVCIRDLVGSELCISSNDGQKVFGIIKSAISQGNKVRISFENIKSISAAFLDSAIGQLYDGEVQGNIDEKLSFDNISPGRRLVTERAIREAKAYYSDPEGYLAKMKKIFADD